MAPYLLIDGYNVIAPVAPPGLSAERPGAGTWLRRERLLLLDRLADHLPAAVLERTCVVFDSRRRHGAAEAKLRHRGIEVRFAVDHDEADDLIEEILQQHPHPKRLTVVSSDHRVQAAAKRKRAAVYDSETWLDCLLDGRPLVRKLPRQRKQQPDEKTAGSGPASPQRPGGGPRDADIAIPDEQLEQWFNEFGGVDGSKSGDSGDPPN